MPWNAAVDSEYQELIEGNMGQALDLQGPAWIHPTYIAILKGYLQQLETGSAMTLALEPTHPEGLLGHERMLLHLMRAACSMYVERNHVFPWQIRDKTVEHLRPLLSYHYQGLRPVAGLQRFHHVWDTKPGERMVQSILAYAFMSFGGDAPADEFAMVEHAIQNLRDQGFRHMAGHYDDYRGYPNHTGGVWDFEVVAEVKRTGCHMMADFLVCLLRPFNISAHYGRGFGVGAPQPVDDAAYDAKVHHHGHCFVHFPTISRWLSHADDVYTTLLRYIPPYYALRTTSWMSQHHAGATEYEWYRADLHDSYWWWCIMLADHPAEAYNVRWLYEHALLREQLENVHIDNRLAELPGAPAVVTPVFSEAEVEQMMTWGAFKLG